MVLTRDQEKEIYTAYKEIFSKEYASFRKQKPIQQRIDKTRNDPTTRTVNKKYSQDEVVKTVRMLLEAKVFESETIAKRRFARGEPSPPPTPEPVTSQPVAPKLKNIELKKDSPGPVKELLQDPLNLAESKGVAFTNLDSLLGISSDPTKVQDPVKVEQEHSEGSQVDQVHWNESSEELQSVFHLPKSDSALPKDPAESRSLITNQGKAAKTAAAKGIQLVAESSHTKETVAEERTPLIDNTDAPFTSPPQSLASSLNDEDTTTPVQAYPPLRTQHLILRRIQTILEHICFDFAGENMPDILESMQWECPEAGELNIWMCHLKKKSIQLEHLARSDGVEFPLSSLLSSGKQIRHLAVHRQPVHGNYLALLADHAVALGTILGGPGSGGLGTLQMIRDSVKSQLESLSDLKRSFDTALGSTLSEIASRRAELDMLEQKSIQEAQDGFEGHRAVAWNEVELLVCQEKEPLPSDLPKKPQSQDTKTQAEPTLWYRTRHSLAQMVGLQGTWLCDLAYHISSVVVCGLSFAGFLYMLYSLGQEVASSQDV
ncbi:hypothetical protein ACLX1H_010119 [Fusarium chlamydosporum]